MKRKALIAVLLSVMALGALFTTNVQAAGWYTCNISQVQVLGGGYYLVTLSDTATTPAWVGNVPFVLNPNDVGVKSMFVTALTGFANSTNVLAWLDALTPNSVCFGMGAAK